MTPQRARPQTIQAAIDAAEKSLSDAVAGRLGARFYHLRRNEDGGTVGDLRGEYIAEQQAIIERLKDALLRSL